MSKRLIRDVSKLTDSDKTKIRQRYGFKSTKQLIKSVEELFNLGISDTRKMKLAFRYYADEYNADILENRIQNKLKVRQKKADLKKTQMEVKNFIKSSSKSKIFIYKNLEELKKIVMSLQGEKVQLKIAGVIYALNNRTFNRLIDLIESGNIFITEGEAISSDEELLQVLNYSSEVEVIKLDTKKNKIKGGYFNRKHLLKNVDLSSIQIYEDSSGFKGDINCLVHSLVQFGIDNNYTEDWNLKMEQIKRKVITSEVSQVKVKEVAEFLKICISIKRTESNNNIRYYGNKDSEIKIPLALIEEHYFLIRKMEITSYAVKNYHDIKDKDRWNEMIKRSGARDKARYIDSYTLVNLLISENLVEKYKKDELYGTGFANKTNDLQEPHYKENNCPEYISKKDNTYYEDYKEVFFDFETTTEGDKHIPYLVVCEGKTFYGVDCGYEMLCWIGDKYKCKPIRLIAHNAGYDIRFLAKYLRELFIIERGHFLLRANGKFGRYKLQIQDSYALIAMRLSEFSGVFGMEQKKEIMPYGLYTQDSVKERYIDMDICLEACKKEYENKNIGASINIEKQKEFCDHFINNCKDWGIINNDKIDILEYSNRYCLIDVAVLKEGWKTFKKWIKEVCDLDTGDYVSLPSLANDFMMKQGVFDDVKYLSDGQREFIQKTLVGGRTMVRENKKCKINRDVDDFDAVSLYPSAMKRLGGYLKGNPKPLTEKNYEFLKTCDGYFIEIIINKVNKHYAFPLMSEMTDEGIRNFTNDMEGKTMFVDKISLEDLIEFHEIEFEVVRGYYYNEGRNEKLLEVISYLFQARIDAKKNKNPIQNVYKLLMNSAYGKTIMKPIDDEMKFVDKKDYETYVSKNFTFIKEVEEITGSFYKVKLYKELDTHQNLCSCGIEVLSMSKRIMNEVMCLAEDNDLMIYYQDTDSMHINTEEVSVLTDLYRDKYNRELVGKDMCQFHVDFDSKFLKGELKSVESIFLGKKCYIDKLQGDEEGVYDYHIRMKGVSGDAIKDYAFNNGIGLMEVYDDLYNGKEINFDLCCGGKKLTFDFKYNMEIASKKVFERKIKF